MPKYMFEVGYEIKQCLDCPCYTQDGPLFMQGNNAYCCVEGLNKRLNDYVKNETKPHWCPLKEVKENE